MEFSLASDGHGSLRCELADGQNSATVTASNAATAASDLARAIDGVTGSGYGECYWRQAGGEYRWLFRREGEKVRIAVLWSTGTLTGWEHVFWSECDFDAFARQVGAEISRAG